MGSGAWKHLPDLVRDYAGGVRNHPPVRAQLLMRAPQSVLTRAEHIEAVFRNSDRHVKASSNDSGYLMGELLGQCVGLISLDRWRRVRAETETPFRHNVCRGYVAMVEKETLEYLDHLWNHDGGCLTGLIDPVSDLKMLPFYIVADIIYGTLSAEMKQDLMSLTPQRESLFIRHVIQGGLSRFHASKYLPTAANQALSDFQTKWWKFNDAAYRRASTTYPDAPIVSMYKAMEAKRLSRAELLQTLDEMLYANLDVTMGAISWNLVFLAAHPDVQDTLRQEAAEQRAASRPKELGGSTFEDYLWSSSTLLAACTYESSRLQPLAAFSVPQSAPTEHIIDGFRVPAGTNFIVDTYALNVRNPFWGADRDTYRPGRFLERKSRTETRYNYWRFGFGPRQCMGKYVADLMTRTLLVLLLERWELVLPGDAKGKKEWAKDKETWINHPKMKLGWKVRR